MVDAGGECVRGKSYLFAAKRRGDGGGEVMGRITCQPAASPSRHGAITSQPRERSNWRRNGRWASGAAFTVCRRKKKKRGGRRYLSYVGFGTPNRRQHARARGKRTAPRPPARHGLPQGPLLHPGRGNTQECVGRGWAAGWAPRHARAPEMRSMRGAAPPAPIASGPNATSRRQKKRLSTATTHSRRQPGGQVGLARGAAFCE